MRSDQELMDLLYSCHGGIIPRGMGDVICRGISIHKIIEERYGEHLFCVQFYLFDADGAVLDFKVRRCSFALTVMVPIGKPAMWLLRSTFSHSSFLDESGGDSIIPERISGMPSEIIGRCSRDNIAS